MTYQSYIVHWSLMPRIQVTTEGVSPGHAKKTVFRRVRDAYPEAKFTEMRARLGCDPTLPHYVPDEPKTKRQQTA